MAEHEGLRQDGVLEARAAQGRCGAFSIIDNAWCRLSQGHDGPHDTGLRAAVSAPPPPQQEQEGDSARVDVPTHEATTGSTASENEVRSDKRDWVIDNIYTIARRETIREQDGKPLRPEMWGHVRRLCEQVGARDRVVGVLRNGD